MKILTLTLLALLTGVAAHAQDPPAQRVLVGFDLQMHSSKPNNDRSARQDPAILMHFAYPVGQRMAVGLGTGVMSPYYTETLLPAYVQATYWPSTVGKGFFLTGRGGKCLPTKPEDFDGGVYTEISSGVDFLLDAGKIIRLGIGFSHQRLRTKQSDFWWGETQTEARYNRAVFTLGMLF